MIYIYDILYIINISSMVLNAFCRSINIAIVDHSASRDDTIFSVI